VQIAASGRDPVGRQSDVERVGRCDSMDLSELEGAYEELVRLAGTDFKADKDDGSWDADTVIAHVIASSRIVAAATAELLAGRIPVVDNRATQSLPYLKAIAAGAGSRTALVSELRSAGREVTLLVGRLGAKQLVISVPTIILDADTIRVQRPVPFVELAGSGHLEEHLSQLKALRS
jgi:hypothetical protein